jgi:hypothetical protein
MSRIIKRTNMAVIAPITSYSRRLSLLAIISAPPINTPVKPINRYHDITRRHHLDGLGRNSL